MLRKLEGVAIGFMLNLEELIQEYGKHFCSNPLYFTVFKRDINWFRLERNLMSSGIAVLIRYLTHFPI